MNTINPLLVFNKIMYYTCFIPFKVIKFPNKKLGFKTNRLQRILCGTCVLIQLHWHLRITWKSISVLIDVKDNIPGDPILRFEAINKIIYGIHVLIFSYEKFYKTKLQVKLLNHLCKYSRKLTRKSESKFFEWVSFCNKYLKRR